MKWVEDSFRNVAMKQWITLHASHTQLYQASALPTPGEQYQTNEIPFLVLNPNEKVAF